MNTTQANILLIAPELSTISAGLWTLVLADVAEEITENDYPESKVEILQRYLGAHYLTKQIRGSNNNQSESVIDSSFSRFSSDNELMTTSYGATFLRLKKNNQVLTGC
ncbi:MAG TPA: DUF4054 domain-containing protein [bacterium]|nr:DUF4054 domain-containing protein [bacterium]